MEKQALVHLNSVEELRHGLTWTEEKPPSPEGGRLAVVAAAIETELFKKVLPHQCLGSIWSQRTEPRKGHMVSTVSATVLQFNHVATCVITTCLGDPSMTAQDRANMVEHWIKVAKECRTLRNFSSLRAILAALQSVSIHRLQETWGKVSRYVFVEGGAGQREVRDTHPGQEQSSNDDILEEQANRFTDASNGYKGKVVQAKRTVQCKSETSKEDIFKVVAHGPDYTTYQVRVQVNQADDTVQCLSESSNRVITEGLVSGFNYSNSLNLRKVHQATDTIQGWTQCAAELTQRLREACRMRVIQKGTLEKVMGSLVPAFPAGNIPHVCTLMPIHPAFSRAQWFLEELLTRATASVMGTWPDLIQHFGQPLLFPGFIVKQTLVLHSLPVKCPVGLVRSLWVELQQQEPTEAQWEELKHTQEPEEGPAPGLEPNPGVIVLEPSGPPALIQEPAPSPTTDCPVAVTLKHHRREEKLGLLTFPPRLVAEQITAMDAELFKKVLPHQCLGSIWSQRTKPRKGHMVSTVSATVLQFNHVATCVITTCLGDPSMTAQDRAKVVEHWIKVAKECRTLRNFSSLRAILAALQSVSIHRLQETWGKVSRRHTVAIKKLFKEDNSRSREQFIKCVPFLGEYLTLLHRMDASMKDDLEVDKILQEIVVLQEAAQNYKIQPENNFQAWFWALKRLSEHESYIRSCQLEPQS
uniref:Ras-GEF domain-containing protein n=1 Tax=Pipistrellus kuhlii TaxID=59472 RepID=A0A7J7VV30_PIPKU|nr:hypothetical protein mPipKuh1_008322 [Pipistrellus kuhlii]